MIYDDRNDTSSNNYYLIYRYVIWYFIRYWDFKKGQKYRNFFKAVVAGLGVYMLLGNITALKISLSSTVVFLLYILSVASAFAFIPPLMDNNYEWLLIASIVIGLSALLHVYVRFINKVMFNSDLGEAD